MGAEMEGAKSPRALRYLEKWSKLVGPEYAKLLLPIWRSMLRGYLIAIAGGAAVVIGLGGIPNVPPSVGGVAVTFLALLVITPFVVGGIKFVRLELRIQRDLEAAGFTVKPGGPDLRSPSIFSSWSRRSGITAENIIATGRAVLGGGD